MRVLTFAMAALALSAVPAAAATGFTFGISGNANTPRISLTNTSSTAELTRFNMLIGDMAYNYDAAYALSGVLGGIYTLNRPDQSTGGGVRSDDVDLTFLGFDAGESFGFNVDVDIDNANTVEDYRSVLFNNGSAPNAVLTAMFDDGMTATFTLPDAPGAGSYSYQVSAVAAPIPVPAALPLMLSGIALTGALARRRR